MSLFEKLSARLPFSKKKTEAEYFFALNIDPEKLTAALWSIESDQLNLISTSSEGYSSTDEIIKITDKLLDICLGDFPHEPSKILFGVPDSWLLDDDLKEPYLKILRELVKELELTPMAYVATSHALLHFLEKTEGSPATAILVNIGKRYIDIFSARAGKLDGTATVERSSNLGADIEKGILSGVSAEVLPSKIAVFGDGNLDKQKSELLSYPWMSKLSFLHIPKIEILKGDIQIMSVCLAGAVEVNPDVKFNFAASEVKSVSGLQEMKKEEEAPSKDLIQPEVSDENLGFIAGDIANVPEKEEIEKQQAGNILDSEEGEVAPSESVVLSPEKEVAWEDEQSSRYGAEEEHVLPEKPAPRSPLDMEPTGSFEESGVESRLAILNRLSLPGGGKRILLVAAIILVLLGLGLMFIPRAQVLVYVEPRILEKDAQVIADPSIKSVDEGAQKIPGEIISTQATGAGTGPATGKKQIGNAAKGTVIIYNKTSNSITLSKGTILTTATSSGRLKFTLDTSVSVPPETVSDSGINFGKTNPNPNVTADSIGPDGNLASTTELTVGNYPSSQLSAKAEGNFSGGTSQEVTVVSSDDQSKLLASVLSDLRSKAVTELQAKLTSGKKVLPETLTENVTKKSFNKNVNDQAQNFTLNLSVNYKGTAFSDTDLKTMVAKLVETNVPDGFVLNLSDSETQADVSHVDKDGKVVFTARFRAKLMPKIDIDKIRRQLMGKSISQAADILRSYENVLGSEIKITPSLPGPLQRLPLLDKNITVEVGLK